MADGTVVRVGSRWSRRKKGPCVAGAQAGGAKLRLAGSSRGPCTSLAGARGYSPRRATVASVDRRTSMIEIIGLAITFGATIVGHVGARRFVRERLRFVDAVQRRRAPWIAGGAALLLATPIAWVI